MIITFMVFLWLLIILTSSLFSNVDLIPFIPDYSAKKRLVRAIPLSVISGVLISEAIKITLVESIKRSLGIYKTAVIVLAIGITIAIYSEHIIRTLEELDKKTS